MFSFPEALELLLANTPLQPAESCKLEETAGRVLRSPVTADRDFPAFDRVMMDGYALRSVDWASGLRAYRVAGSAPAGAPPRALPDEAGACLEVMTGAPCPEGADCIVPVEEVIGREGDEVIFSEETVVVPGEYLHRRGSDAKAGQVLLAGARVLGSREIGVAASCGASVLEVSGLPRIAVVATGDELVPVEQVPEPHQIRQSNGWSLAACLERAGYPVAEVAVLNDEVSLARPALRTLLGDHDWIILTGAVSMGSRDFVPSLLDALGCRKLFHGVAHRPGKPAGCWIGPEGQMILALPGNPVSALTGLHVFGLPALAAACGRSPAPARLVAMDGEPPRLEKFTRHLPVKLKEDGRVEPAATGNSGDFIGLLASDGFITLPPRGETAVAFPYTPWH